MKVQYRDDETAGPGNGFLIFSEALFPEGPWNAAIQRASDQMFLTGRSANSWVGETFFIPLDGTPDDGGLLSLKIGPSVVNALDQQEQYRVQLKGRDGSAQTAPLRIERITYSPSGSLDNTGATAPGPGEAAATPPETAAHQEKTSEKIVEQPAEAAEKEEIILPEPQPQKETGRKIWRYALLALLALGCLIWFIVDRNRKEADADKPAVAEQQKEEKSPAAAKNEPVAAGKAENKNSGAIPEGSGAALPVDIPSTLSASERARQFFLAPNCTPAAAVQFAATLPRETTADKDAVYRLWYYAATNEEPAAFMDYAGCIDPSKPQWGTIEKDGSLAWRIYREAQAKGIPGASQALENLGAWLKAKAESGDSQAKLWLSQIK